MSVQSNMCMYTYIDMSMCIYTYIYACIIDLLSQKLGTSSAAVWLMSVALLGPALEVFREIRWSLSSPTGCPFGLVGIALILVSSCCFCCGICVGICIVSHRCRLWIWHCLVAAEQLWNNPVTGRGTLEIRQRFREYRA